MTVRVHQMFLRSWWGHDTSGVLIWSYFNYLSRSSFFRFHPSSTSVLISFSPFLSLSLFLFSLFHLHLYFISIGRLISFQCVVSWLPSLPQLPPLPQRTLIWHVAQWSLSRLGAALALARSLLLSQYTRKDDAVFSLRFESRSNEFSNTPVLPFRLLVDRLCYCYCRDFFLPRHLTSFAVSMHGKLEMHVENDHLTSPCLLACSKCFIYSLC